MSGTIPDGPKLRCYLMWGTAVRLRISQSRSRAYRYNGQWSARITPSWLRWQSTTILSKARIFHMVRKFLIVAAMVTMVSSAWGGLPTERRSADALFKQTEGCIEVITLVTMTQNAVTVSTEYQDGWVRTAWLTVEQNDTCARTQLLNAAGQLSTITGLEIDRKLGYADWIGTITVWDGISQTEGQFTVQVRWQSVGPVTRGFHTLSRDASATLAADGMGLSLRNTTTTAHIEIAK